ncbi:hypothetical protein KIH74_27960 [Kineosporia sp. J2-2]|uniref:Beta protein n=1 Tax=Kineosporia corallincola TaxID=2835133 RepID=A0ABS5TR76_9ACTN|nr:hypothetical protein [Kineosporia corallincola]MBT0772809.1 hypothetical protein [Kineosporia corallincola]
MRHFDGHSSTGGAGEGAVYVPVLQAHAGELAALKRMSAGTRARTCPLLEIVPDSGFRLHQPGGLRDWFEVLAANWPQRVMVDGHHLRPPETRGRTGLGTIVEEARGLAGQMVPVIRLDADEPTRADARAALRTNENGIAVRIRVGPRELVTAGEELILRLRALLGQIRATVASVDLVIDLELVEDDAVARLAARHLSRFIDRLPAVQSYRSVIVTSGTFPPHLGKVRSWTLTPIIRYDVAVWEFLKAEQPQRMPVYGDYAISHPVRYAPSSGNWRPAPQLRYTTPMNWLVLRGTQRGDPRRHGQFFEICRQISQHPDFSDGLGPADRCIAEPERHLAGPGGGKLWKELGIAHHADFVVDSIGRSGLP